jgi:hypothetical protein
MRIDFSFDTHEVCYSCLSKHHHHLSSRMRMRNLSPGILFGEVHTKSRNYNTPMVFSIKYIHIIFMNLIYGRIPECYLSWRMRNLSLENLLEEVRTKNKIVIDLSLEHRWSVIGWARYERTRTLAIKDKCKSSFSDQQSDTYQLKNEKSKPRKPVKRSTYEK